MAKDRLKLVDLQDAFPKLHRGRELFTRLFQNRSPLVNLGYTSIQQEYTIPVLRLIASGGVIGEVENHQWLKFFNNADVGYLVTLSKYKDSPAFNLLARRQPYEDLKVCVFRQQNPRVANITLIDNNAQINLTDLKEIVPLVYRVAKEKFYKGLTEKNPVSTLTQKLGLNTTFEAMWLDDSTKLEFAIKLQKPRKKEQVAVWRRLAPLEDDVGSFTPFGEKANSNTEKVIKIMQTKHNGIVHGNLTYDL